MHRELSLEKWRCLRRQAAKTGRTRLEQETSKGGPGGPCHDDDDISYYLQSLSYLILSLVPKEAKLLWLNGSRFNTIYSSSPVFYNAVGMNWINLLREPRGQSSELKHYPTKMPHEKEPPWEKRGNDFYPRRIHPFLYLENTAPVSNFVTSRRVIVCYLVKNHATSPGGPLGLRLTTKIVLVMGPHARVGIGDRVVLMPCACGVKSFSESRHGNLSYEGANVSPEEMASDASHLLVPRDLSIVSSPRSSLVNILSNDVVDAAIPPILPGHVGTGAMAGTAYYKEFPFLVGDNPLWHLPYPGLLIHTIDWLHMYDNRSPNNILQSGYEEIVHNRERSIESRQGILSVMLVMCPDASTLGLVPAIPRRTASSVVMYAAASFPSPNGVQSHGLTRSTGRSFQSTTDLREANPGSNGIATRGASRVRVRALNSEVRIKGGRALRDFYNGSSDRKSSIHHFGMQEPVVDDHV
ncbi:hypothetical protein IW262DRAFT_1299460 [Armillaria fumosa]|nr:hypothetical protein IW262DRAFT_1299460 [Armillaria fumosa]